MKKYIIILLIFGLALFLIFNCEIDHGLYPISYLIKGKVEYQIGEEAVTLMQGDSMYFDGNLPHRSKCLKQGESQAIVILHTSQV